MHINMRLLPSQEYLQECFDYNEELGELIWKVRPLHHFKSSNGMNIFNSKYVNKIAGTIHNVTNYKIVNIRGTGYSAQRLIFKLKTGQEPTFFIDHINGIRNDNRWDNLREATMSQNCCNRKIKSTNLSGYTGVRWVASHNMWRAEINYKKITHHLGYFKNKEDAIKARRDAELELHGEFSGSNRSNHLNNQTQNCDNGLNDIQILNDLSNDIEFTGCF